MKQKDILKTRRTLPSISNALHWADLPALEAEILLAHALEVSRTSLFAHPETKLDHTYWEKFQNLVDRRHTGEPIAYLIGYKEFYGMKLKTDPRALIPREETEDLVLEALKLNPSSVADLGTGCGAIALALAKHLPNAKIYASDVSREAIDLAQENAEALGLQDQVTFLIGHLANRKYLRTLGERTVCNHAPARSIECGWDAIGADGGIDAGNRQNTSYQDGRANDNP